MAAGLGFKTFTTGEVLTAADTNGYLMQGVLVFASAAARDAAITSPQEGQFAYLKDTNVTTYYTGAAWANLDTTGMTNPMTTTGDIVYASSGSTPGRIGIGSTGNVLTVAGGIPSWAAPAAGGGMTVIGSGNLTGSSISISGITGYNDLQLVLRDYYPGSVAAMDVRVNALDTNEYNFVVYRQDGTSTSNTGQGGFRLGDNANGQTDSDGDNAVIFNFYDVQNTTAKKLVDYLFVFKDDGGVNRLTKTNGFLNSTAAISTVVMLPSTGTWGGGSYILYGVK